MPSLTAGSADGRSQRDLKHKQGLMQEQLCITEMEGAPGTALTVASTS